MKNSGGKPGFSYPTTEPFNFGGLEEQNYRGARVAIFPVPYSSTTYWKSQTKEGPRSLIDASRRLELYDQELKKDTSKVGIYTLPELEVSKNSPKETLERIEAVIKHLLQDKKFPLMLGGEHSITFGAVAPCCREFKDLSVLQLDAHPDLRDEFEGTRYHHGCVMRRIVEDLKLPVTQVGLRSISQEDARFIKKSKRNTVFYAPDLPVEEIIKSLSKNVYITVDVDFFDSSVMPATGTPEPGGYTWYDALHLIKEVARQKKVVAADIVELAPIPGMHAPDFLVAKLAYKLIGYMTEGKI